MLSFEVYGWHRLARFGLGEGHLKLAMAVGDGIRNKAEETFALQEMLRSSRPRKLVRHQLTILFAINSITRQTRAHGRQTSAHRRHVDGSVRDYLQQSRRECV
jgi:hypothetical protein